MNGHVRLSFGGLSATEKDEASHIGLLLQSMNGYVDQFRSAVALFDSIPRLETLNPQATKIIRQWGFIAGRDGGMTIYHFGRALEAIRAIKKGPVLSERIDHEALKAVARRYAEAFPYYAKVRHAVSHEGDMLKWSPSDPRNPSRSENGLIVSNGFVNRSFTNSYEGELISYSLTDETADILDGIAAGVLLAMKRAIDAPS